MNALILLIYNAVLNGAPLMFGTMGEVLTEKSGNLNLGVEGMMYMGGAIGLGAAFYYEKMAGTGASGAVAVVMAFAFAFLAGAVVEYERPLHRRIQYIVIDTPLIYSVPERYG